MGSLGRITARLPTCLSCGPALDCVAWPAFGGLGFGARPKTHQVGAHRLSEGGMCGLADGLNSNSVCAWVGLEPLNVSGGRQPTVGGESFDEWRLSLTVKARRGSGVSSRRKEVGAFFLAGESYRV